MGRNPFDEVEELLNRLSRQVEEGMARGSGFPSPGSVAVDVADHDDEYVVTADLPGYEIDDIDLRLSEGTLRIEADREASREYGTDVDAGSDDGDDERTEITTTDDEPSHYIRRERTRQSVSRRLRLPEPVDEEAVSASYANGVLTVTLPKLSPGGDSRRIDID